MYVYAEYDVCQIEICFWCLKICAHYIYTVEYIRNIWANKPFSLYGAETKGVEKALVHVCYLPYFT